MIEITERPTGWQYYEGGDCVTWYGDLYIKENRGEVIEVGVYSEQ